MKTPSYPTMTASTRHQGGFVLVLVVFLIVVLAGAAVAISQLTVDTSAAQNQALQSTRAQQFNQSGVEVATHYLVTEDSPSAAGCTIDTVTNDDFPGLEMNLTCTEQSYNGVTLWTLTAISQSAGLTSENPEYVWKRTTAVVEQ